MGKHVIRFGVIGCGLMGKEFASAAARWCHLTDVDFEPEIIAVCDANPDAIKWFEKNISTVENTYTDYKQLLENHEIDAIYCAVPHHLHEQIYIDIIKAGKHLLGEKPFGMDQKANNAILAAINANPNIVVRCSSEFPFFPGALEIANWVKEGKFGKIIDVEMGFWHSSDLDPNKPINWKRRIETNGEYGCMGDLGMHVLHLPLRFGWYPESVSAHLCKIIDKRPDGKGGTTTCDTWDNAVITTKVKYEDSHFPMILSMKRIAPGHANTWFIRINGTEFSAEFTTKNPKQVSSLPYTPGNRQAWHVVDVPYQSAYDTITGGIFEFGFSDSILQMWAAFCDEVVHGDNMQQSLRCVTLEEVAGSHHIFTAALESNRLQQTILLT